MVRTLSLGMAVLVGLASAGAARAQYTARVSVSSDGEQANDSTGWTVCSGDGRFAVFASSASNLVPGDANGVKDVFIRDRFTGEVSLVSVSTAGLQGDGASDQPAVSADGRYVVFQSLATNLAPGGAAGLLDVFLRDRQLGTTELISASGDGSPSDGESGAADVSDDGRFVAFVSAASNLVAEDGDTLPDIFVRDRRLGVTTLESVTTDGTKAQGSCSSPTLSADGAVLAFASCASNLVGGPPQPCLTANVFVRDRLEHTTTVISTGLDGQPSYGSSGPRLSADGRHVAFSSIVAQDPRLPIASSSGNVFLRDLELQVTQLVNVDSDGQWLDPYTDSAVSRDGRFVAFGKSTEIQPAYVRDMLEGTTQPVTVTLDGDPAVLGGFVSPHAISRDGRFVAFTSASSDLVSTDTNNVDDAFVYDTRPFFTDLGHGLAGSNGTPTLAATGKPLAGDAVSWLLGDAKPSAPSALIIGNTNASAPFKGGTLVPLPQVLIPATTSAAGGAAFAATWPPGVPADTVLYFQWWIEDQAGPAGFAASTALQLTSP
jgi:Tol biopolymer transport system component